MQTYFNGEAVRLGDIVKWPHEEGRIVALQEDLPKWGVNPKKAAGHAMIEFKKTGLVCEETATAEDLVLVRRGAA